MFVRYIASFYCIFWEGSDWRDRGGEGGEGEGEGWGVDWDGG